MTVEFTTDLLVQSIEGDASRGGWQLTGRVINNQDLVAYGRRVEVPIKFVGDGVWETNYSTAFVGWMLPESMTWDKRSSELALTVSTTDAFLANAGVQGIFFVDQTHVTPPYNPHQIADLRLGRIVNHILSEHTNIADTLPGGWVDLSNIDQTTSTSVDVYTVKQNNSIWAALQAIANVEFYVRYFTKDDRFVYEPHPQYATTVKAVRLDIDSSLMVGRPEIQFRTGIKIDQAKLLGLSDTGVIFESNYPTSVGTEGKKQEFSNLRCNSQARLDQLAVRAYKFFNRDYNLRLNLSGAWGVYMELYDRVSVTYTGTSANGVSLDWTEKKFWITNITVDFLTAHSGTTTLTLEEEVL